MTNYQIGKLIHCFGLDYNRTPWRNYYTCAEENQEWEDLLEKGYATKHATEKGIVYMGTHKGLQSVFRKNVSVKYFDSISVALNPVYTI